MSRSASVQAALVGVQAIEDNVLCLSDDRFRAVLEVGSINFALKGDVEQEAIIAGFAAFLNGLDFPVQILIRATAVDVERHLRELERTALQLPEALADLARDHAAFLRRLARSRTLLERRFYLVVPSEAGVPRRRAWPLVRDRAIPVDVQAVQKQLTFRCEEVTRQLGRCGLSARRLVGPELAQLLYAFWCPELARVQKLQRGISEYVVLATTGSRHQRSRPEVAQPALVGQAPVHPQRRP